MTHPVRGTSGPTLDERADNESSSAPSALCACGHPLATHDRVAARYCAATTAGSIERGCLCVAAAVTSPRY